MRADVNPRVCIPHAPDPVFTVAPPGVLQLAVLRLGFATRAADQRSTGLRARCGLGFDGVREISSSLKGAVTISVIMDDLTPVKSCQLSLFEQLKLEPARISQKVQEMMNNLLAKHGTSYFFRPLLTDTGNPLPERRFQLQELTSA